MIQTFTCIVCPNGCEITAKTEGKEICSIEGAACKKGKAYVEQELTAPMRTIASSVPVTGGELPLASVRTASPIPKECIKEAMAEIKKISLTAPVSAGTVIISDLLGTGADVIVTKSVGCA